MELTLSVPLATVSLNVRTNSPLFRSSVNSSRMGGWPSWTTRAGRPIAAKTGFPFMSCMPSSVVDKKVSPSDVPKLVSSLMAFRVSLESSISWMAPF